MCHPCLLRCMAKELRTFMIFQVANMSALVILKQISTVAMEPTSTMMELKYCHVNDCSGIYVENSYYYQLDGCQ